MAGPTRPEPEKKPAQASPKPAAARPAEPQPAAAAKPAAAKAPPAAGKQPPAKPADPKQAAADGGGAEQPKPAGRSMASGFLKQTPAWAVSMILHIVVLLSMALIVSDPPKEEKPRLITSTAPDAGEEFEELEEQPLDQPDMAQEVTDAVVMPDATMVEDVQVVSDSSDLDAAPIAVELTDFSSETATSSDLLSSVGAIGGQAGGLGGRSNPQVRKQLVQAGGGTPQSEAAVEAALKWFIQHQLPDGGWSFDLKQAPSCQGQCSHSGESRAADRCGATAMALLPFLGRGYTHKEGPYKRELEAGLNFLATMTVQGQGRAYGPGGSMYSQGIAGIVLSESYAMTQDKRLAMPAQLALNFIMAAQDPVGGGWRYTPRQPGDTSAVGWQLMALKSGNMAYLQVSPLTVKKAVEFLNAMQSDDGAAYGYAAAGNAPGTTAVGLLCRMYLGWKKDHPALQKGVARLAKSGPNKDLYFDYYATQIMHHIEGEMWIAWNNKMRDMLIDAQAKKGHEVGSWYDGVDGGHGAHAAGRIYCTSLATMILEVYYRHLPIYGQQSVDEEFKD